MDIQASSLFAIQVYIAQLEGLELHAPALIARIDALRAAEIGMRASNRHAFHSLRDFHLATDAATAWLNASILDFATQALTPVMNKKQDWEIQFLGVWAVASDKGGWLMPHNHFPAPWAGVLYLDAEHVVGDDPKDSAGRLDLLCPVPLAEVFGLQPSMSVIPRNGLALLFPGALQHAVYPHFSEKTRYAVSFNLAVKPRG